MRKKCRVRHNPEPHSSLMVKFAVEFWWKMFLTICPSKRSSNISFQTSPEVRHQFRRKLSPTSLWKSLVLKNGPTFVRHFWVISFHVGPFSNFCQFFSPCPAFGPFCVPCQAARLASQIRQMASKWLGKCASTLLVRKSGTSLPHWCKPVSHNFGTSALEPQTTPAIVPNQFGAICRIAQEPDRNWTHQNRWDCFRRTDSRTATPGTVFQRNRIFLLKLYGLAWKPEEP